MLVYELMHSETFADSYRLTEWTETTGKHMSLSSAGLLLSDSNSTVRRMGTITVGDDKLEIAVGFVVVNMASVRKLARSYETLLHQSTSDEVIVDPPAHILVPLFVDRELVDVDDDDDIKDNRLCLTGIIRLHLHIELGHANITLMGDKIHRK